MYSFSSFFCLHFNKFFLSLFIYFHLYYLFMILCKTPLIFIFIINYILFYFCNCSIITRFNIYNFSWFPVNRTILWLASRFSYYYRFSYRLFFLTKFYGKRFSIIFWTFIQMTSLFSFFIIHNCKSLHFWRRFCALLIILLYFVIILPTSCITQIIWLRF